MRVNSDSDTITAIRSFLERKPRRVAPPTFAVSLFSGSGLSDFGYRLAGFEFVAQVEKDSVRAEIGQRNFPNSQWFAKTVEEALSDAVAAVAKNGKRLDALIATPPCQGLSSSNPSRGKRCTEKACAIQQRIACYYKSSPIYGHWSHASSSPRMSGRF